MEKKNIDWGNLGFAYHVTDYRYVSNYKNGAWDEGGLITDDKIVMMFPRKVRERMYGTIPARLCPDCLQVVPSDEGSDLCPSCGAETIDVLHSPYGHDPQIDAFVQEATKDYEYYYTEVLGEALENIEMHLSRESAMGDLLSDAIREAAGTDFAYFNCTSCGKKIAKGPLTRYSIQKAMAFNEKLQVTEMKGSDLYELFELVHRPEIFGNNAELMFSGLKVKNVHG